MRRRRSSSAWCAPTAAWSRARARCGRRPPERYVTWDHADDGSLLLRARLPAEEGALVLAALEAGVERAAARALPRTSPRRTRRAAEALGRCERAFPRRRAWRAARTFPRRRAARRGSERRADALRADGRHAAGERAAARAAAIATRWSCTSTPPRCADREDGRRELADGTPLARRDGAPARLRRRDRAADRARRTAAERRPQDAQRPAGAAPRAREPRPRLPLPRLHQPSHRRRAPHRALGQRRRDEPREPRAALPPPSPAAARGRLQRRPRQASDFVFRRPDGRRDPAVPRSRAAAAARCGTATVGAAAIDPEATVTLRSRRSLRPRAQRRRAAARSRRPRRPVSSATSADATNVSPSAPSSSPCPRARRRGSAG